LVPPQLSLDAFPSKTQLVLPFEEGGEVPAVGVVPTVGSGVGLFDATNEEAQMRRLREVSAVGVLSPPAVVTKIL
jgi:hypothetical protein